MWFQSQIIKEMTFWSPGRDGLSGALAQVRCFRPLRSTKILDFPGPRDVRVTYQCLTPSPTRTHWETSWRCMCSTGTLSPVVKWGHFGQFDVGDIQCKLYVGHQLDNTQWSALPLECKVNVNRKTSNVTNMAF